MNDIQRKIIKYLQPFMDTELEKGCIVNDTDWETGWAEIFSTEYGNGSAWIMMRYNDLEKPYLERKKDVECWEVIGQYDFSALLKCIEFYKSKGISYTIDQEKLIISSKTREYSARITSLYSYSEEENIQLLELLKYLKRLR